MAGGGGEEGRLEDGKRCRVEQRPNRTSTPSWPGTKSCRPGPCHQRSALSATLTPNFPGTGPAATASQQG